MNRKLNKLTLSKNMVDQSDILQKKEMKNLLGGFICIYKCGGGNGDSFGCATLDQCYDEFGDRCPGGGGLHCD